jgi:murein DD-endopeptidase MepM/ murein hydrolase activator NlpD
MRNVLRTLLCVLLGLLIAAPAGAARRRGHDPTETELQADANQAAARMARAQSLYERLDADIARLERQVDALRAQMAPLRETVTRRVVAVYQGQRGLEGAAGLEDVSDPMESARGARLAAEASAGDLGAIRTLSASSVALRRRQEALAVRKQQQQVALTQLEGERREVQDKLTALLAAAPLQHRLLAVGPPRASRSARLEPAPVDPATIRVATDFVCPIVGPLAFADTWGALRSGGRRHEGTDLMNPFGTPNVAVVSGTFQRHHSGAGGLGIYLHGDDGNTYYYAHLSEVVGPDRRVAQGEVIARTGNSGNASGGSPHTHFEFHPGGGRAVNSYPLIKAHC